MRDQIELELKKLVNPQNPGTEDPLDLVKVSVVMGMVDLYGSGKFAEGQCHALEQLSKGMKPSIVRVKEAIEDH